MWQLQTRYYWRFCGGRLPGECGSWKLNLFRFFFAVAGSQVKMWQLQTGYFWRFCGSRLLICRIPNKDLYARVRAVYLPRNNELHLTTTSPRQKRRKQPAKPKSHGCFPWSKTKMSHVVTASYKQNKRTHSNWFVLSWLVWKKLFSWWISHETKKRIPLIRWWHFMSCWKWRKLLIFRQTYIIYIYKLSAKTPSLEVILPSYAQKKTHVKIKPKITCDMRTCEKLPSTSWSWNTLAHSVFFFLSKHGENLKLFQAGSHWHGDTKPTWIQTFLEKKKWVTPFALHMLNDKQHSLIVARLFKLTVGAFMFVNQLTRLEHLQLNIWHLKYKTETR